MKRVRQALNRFLRGFGYSLERYDWSSHPLARRMWLVDLYRVDLVLDVGAHLGWYAAEMRAHGYRGRIVSFEPLRDPYRQLARLTQKDPMWQAVNVALGDRDEHTQINISGNAESSSMLPMLPRHLQALPESAYVASEDCTVCRLDSIWSRYCDGSERALLKIDSQGYEHAVLQGAQESLRSVVGIQLEMSLVPLYEGAPLFGSMMDDLVGSGYSLMGLELGFTDEATGQLLQVDGIFYRHKC